MEGFRLSVKKRKKESKVKNRHEENQQKKTLLWPYTSIVKPRHTET